MPHYLLMVVPPDTTTEVPVPMPRELIFVVDTSGSMHGASIAQAKQALGRALDGLAAGDRFNIIEFNSDTRALYHQSVPADAANIGHARRFVERLCGLHWTRRAGRAGCARSCSSPMAASVMKRSSTR